MVRIREEYLEWAPQLGEWKAEWFPTMTNSDFNGLVQEALQPLNSYLNKHQNDVSRVLGVLCKMVGGATGVVGVVLTSFSDRRLGGVLTAALGTLLWKCGNQESEHSEHAELFPYDEHRCLGCALEHVGDNDETRQALILHAMENRRREMEPEIIAGLVKLLTKNGELS